jgi:hypothetical protein
MAISAKEYQKRLQLVANPSWLENEVAEIVRSDEKTLKERKEFEFTRGLRPDGTKIGQYSKTDEGQSYADFKFQRNPLAGFGYVDLLLTRQFFNSMILRPRYRRAFIFDATDDKRDGIISKYGIDVLGISQEYFEERQTMIYKLALVYAIKKRANIG